MKKLLIIFLLSSLVTSGQIIVTGITVQVDPRYSARAAPTNPVVDDATLASTFNWTNNPRFTALSDYEISLNAGSSYATVTAKPYVVGDIALAANMVRLRVKGVGGYPASDYITNSTAYTVGGTAPAAPTNGLVNNDYNNYFEWTNNPSFTLSEHEISLDNGVSYATATANPFLVGDISAPIGYVRVRVTAIGANPASGYTQNNIAFTVQTTPAAPTNGIVDDAANTFSWTANPFFTSLSDNEQSINGGSTWQAATNPVLVGEVYKAAGQVVVRVKALFGNPAGGQLSNATAFTVTPAAPTNPVVDDVTVQSTFNWTNNPSFTALSDYEISINSGSSYTTITAKPHIIGDVALAANTVRLRVKATGGNPPSNYITNATAYTVWGGGGATTLPVIAMDQFVNKNVNDPSFTLSATSNNAETGISFSSTNTNVISISGNTATVVGEGFADIIASQVATTNFAASSVINRIAVFPNLSGTNVSYNPTYSATTALITNGLYSVEIPRTGSFNSGSPSTALVPLQNFTHGNGTWANSSGPIYFDNQLGNFPNGLAVNVLVNAAHKVVIEVYYTFDRPAYIYGADINLPAGPGFYRATFTVRRGEKSWSMEEHTDCDIEWYIPVSNGLTIDRARWRGYSSYNQEQGYVVGSNTYPNYSNGGYDFTVDVDMATTRSFPWLLYWDPAGAGEGTGRYWQFYNNAEGSSGNLFGIFAGQASRMIGATAFGPYFVTTGGMAYIKSSILRRKGGADNIYMVGRAETGFFISNKSDLLAYNVTQPINIAWNNWGGLGRKIDYYKTTALTPTAAFEQAAIYQPSATIQAFISRIKTDVGFANDMGAFDYILPNAIATMRNPTDGNRSVATQVASIVTNANEMQTAFKTGLGIADFAFIHWKLAGFGRLLMTEIMFLLADPQAALTTQQRSDILQVAAMLTRVAWDNDFAPYHADPSITGAHLGTGNMPVQHNGARRSWSLMFGNDIEMQQRASVALAQLKAEVLTAISVNGEPHGSSHYQQPGLAPMLFGTLQLRQAGYTDLGITEPYKTRFEKYGDFLKAEATPISSRWQNYRKITALSGDGQEESNELPALIASLVQAPNTTLATQLNALYHNGLIKNSDFGTMVLAVDLTTTYSPASFSSGSSNYPDYMSHARFNVGTINEVAVQTLVGNTNNDHRANDRGETTINIKGIPVVVAGSSFYSPHKPTELLKSVVVPAASFPNWVGSLNIFNPGPYWTGSVNLEYAKLEATVITRANHSITGSVWTRKVVTINANPINPIVVFIDAVDNAADNVFVLPITAEDSAVSTPAGSITPTAYNDFTLPVSTAEQTSSGNINAWTFTGANYDTAYFTPGGLNHRVLSVGASTFTLSQWTSNHNVSAGGGQGLWGGTDGVDWMERSQYLRIKKAGDMFNILLSYDKGTTPFSTATETGGKVTFTDATGTYIISKDGYWYDNGTTQRIVSFGTATFSHNPGSGVHSISGGIGEVTITGGTYTARIHGSTASRTFVTPGSGTDVISYTTNGLPTLTTEQGFTSYDLLQLTVQSLVGCDLLSIF